MRPAPHTAAAETLEDANVKLMCVGTDSLGGSGRVVLAALTAGETDPEPLKASRADIVATVHGSGWRHTTVSF